MLPHMAPRMIHAHRHASTRPLVACRQSHAGRCPPPGHRRPPACGAQRLIERAARDGAPRRDAPRSARLAPGRPPHPPPRGQGSSRQAGRVLGRGLATLLRLCALHGEWRRLLMTSCCEGYVAVPARRDDRRAPGGAIRALSPRTSARKYGASGRYARSRRLESSARGAPCPPRPQARPARQSRAARHCSAHRAQQASLGI